MNKILLILQLCFIFFACAKDESHFEKNSVDTFADIIIKNAQVITVNKNFDIVNAIAIKGKKILTTGDFADLKNFKGSQTKVIDAKKRSVLPAFEDSHIHYLMTLRTSKDINLGSDDIKRIDDLVVKVAYKVKKEKPGIWITGFGWDQEKIVWDKKRAYKWPSRLDLDNVSPDNPVLLFRVDGHVAVANSKALSLAGIDRFTKDSAGGVIDRFASGEPSGILKESAVEMVAKLVPEFNFTFDELEKFSYFALSNGLASVQEANLNKNELKFYEKAFSKNKMPLRVNVLLNYQYLDELIDKDISTPYEIIPYHLRICGVKFFADGTLGARTAALRQPYTDDPYNSGILLHSVDWFTEMFTRAHKNGIQVCTHAIGDLAIATVLKANLISYNNIDLPPGTYRDRIEHCQIMSSEIIDEFISQQMIASIQFSFWASDRGWVMQRLGEDRLAYAYAWRKLLDRGVRVTGGTDSPVETFLPLAGIENIVKNSNVTVEEAIKLYTMDSAYAAWQDKYLGSLESGKFADLIVLSGDILKTPLDNISALDVDLTLLDGKVVYTSHKFPL